MNVNRIKLTPKQSCDINLLKGFAILLVVFIHAKITVFVAQSDMTATFDVYSETINRILVNNAVPMFFFISGFLFFLKKDSFKNKIKKRFHTLVIPYVLWCAWGFLIPFVLQRILGLESMFTGGHMKLLRDFEALDYIRIFYDVREGAPILSTLWFLRDLIVMVMLTPAIYWLIGKCGKIFPVLMLVMYLFLPFNFNGLASSGLFFFSMGCYTSLVGIGKLEQRISLKWYIPIWALMLLGTIVCYVKGWHYHDAMRVFIIANSIFYYKGIKSLSTRYDMSSLVKLSAASFFIYLLHEPFMGYMITIVMKYLHPTGTILYIMPIVFVLFTILGCYGVYVIMQRCCPGFLNTITGDRIMK